MLSKLKLAKQLWRYMGPSWLFFRVKYAIQVRSGWLRHRMPAFEWKARPLHTWLKTGVPVDPEAYQIWRRENGRRFFFDALPQISADVPWDTQQVVDEANAVLAGHLRYFHHTVYNVGFPPNWHLNPMTGQRVLADRHWTQISDFGQGDIKLVWEASRFGVVYTLVRAYALTRDERYPGAFWTLVEDWAQKNPPNMGPNWKCGQEATFRVMAWCFGLYGFSASGHTTPNRIAALAAMIGVHGERIERNIAYAQSQKNNHAISEAVGLWTIGLLFPEFKSAARWRKTGYRVIQSEAERQIYDDGAYIQNSLNYHRLMLHNLLWALRLGEVNNERLPEPIYVKFRKATEFLYQLLDLESGQVPNYGANDGALILPLNICDYLDYRPVLQTSHYLLTGSRLFDSGPWDEDLLWLFGPNALNTAPIDPAAKQVNLVAPIGGYYTLRGQHSWAVIRCAEYHDRPSHADQLHFDLWWRGNNIACDAGTYLYNADPPWDNSLTRAHVHNTIVVDGQDSMLRAGRFLWLDWDQGCRTHFNQSLARHLVYWQGSHNGCTQSLRPVLHQRAITRIDQDRWIVLDKLDSEGEHDYTLHWLLPDIPYDCDNASGSIILNTPCGPYRIQVGALKKTGQFSVMRSDSESIDGWRSLYYGHRVPAISVKHSLRGINGHFVTLFSPLDSTLTVSEGQISITCPDQAVVITLGASTALVCNITMFGTLEDRLEVKG